MPSKLCVKCKNTFGCESGTGNKCWCFDLKVGAIPEIYKDCLCEKCLREFSAENADFYEENGLIVFTEKFLRERGYCCNSGCRHCPY